MSHKQSVPPLAQFFKVTQGRFNKVTPRSALPPDVEPTSTVHGSSALLDETLPYDQEEEASVLLPQDEVEAHSSDSDLPIVYFSGLISVYGCFFLAAMNFFQIWLGWDNALLITD